jgi:hypothetical protein
MGYFGTIMGYFGTIMGYFGTIMGYFGTIMGYNGFHLKPSKYELLRNFSAGFIYQNYKLCGDN